MMDCSEFLGAYSDFRDGLLEPRDRRSCMQHLSRCEACARYDATVRRGVELLRGLPLPEAGSDFRPRLQHRIYHLEEERRYQARGSGASTGLTFAIAAGIAAAAWAPIMSAPPAPVELPAVAALPPAPVAPENGAAADSVAPTIETLPWQGYWAFDSRSGGFPFTASLSYGAPPVFPASR